MTATTTTWGWEIMPVRPSRLFLRYGACLSNMFRESLFMSAKPESVCVLELFAQRAQTPYVEWYERKLTYFPPQASDIGSPELHVDHHNALFARVHTTFTRILRSHRCAHERSSEGTNFASYRLCTDRSCHWITSTCGWIAVESRGVCDTSTETFERGVQSGLLEAFDTRYLIW